MNVEDIQIDDSMIVTTLASGPVSGRGSVRLSNQALAALAAPSVELQDSDVTTSPRRFLGSGLKPAAGSWSDPHTAALEPKILAVYENRANAGHQTP